MSKDELKHSLDRLRRELDALPEQAVEPRTRVEALIDDIERQLQDVEDADGETDFADRIPHLVGQFEAEHPGMTALLNRIAVLLSNLGI